MYFYALQLGSGFLITQVHSSFIHGGEMLCVLHMFHIQYV